MTSAPTVTVTTPSDLDVVITRVFDTDRMPLWDALTKPDLLRRWLRTPGRTLEICDIDLRPGGSYRFVWRGPGKKDVGMHGTYREVVRGERLVRTEAWEDWDAGETLVTISLAEQAGKTTLITTVRFPSRETRDTVLKSGLDSGVGENYHRLAEVLAALVIGGAKA